MQTSQKWQNHTKMQSVIISHLCLYTVVHKCCSKSAYERCALERSQTDISANVMGAGINLLLVRFSPLHLLIQFVYIYMNYGTLLGPFGGSLTRFVTVNKLNQLFWGHFQIGSFWREGAAENQEQNWNCLKVCLQGGFLIFGVTLGNFRPWKWTLWATFSQNSTFLNISLIIFLYDLNIFFLDFFFFFYKKDNDWTKMV